MQKLLFQTPRVFVIQFKAQFHFSDWIRNIELFIKFVVISIRVHQNETATSFNRKDVKSWAWLPDYINVLEWNWMFVNIDRIVRKKCVFAWREITRIPIEVHTKRFWEVDKVKVEEEITEIDLFNWKCTLLLIEMVSIRLSAWLPCASLDIRTELDAIHWASDECTWPSSITIIWTNLFA